MSSTSTQSCKVMRSCPKPASIVITNTPRWDSCPSRGVQVLRKFYFCQPKTTKYQTKSKRRRLFVRRGGIRQSPTHTHIYTSVDGLDLRDDKYHGRGGRTWHCQEKKLLDSCDYYCRPVGLSHLSPCQRIPTDQRCSLSSHAVKHCDFQLIWLCLLSQITTFFFVWFFLALTKLTTKFSLAHNFRLSFLAYVKLQSRLCNRVCASVFNQKQQSKHEEASPL